MHVALLKIKRQNQSSYNPNCREGTAEKQLLSAVVNKRDSPQTNISSGRSFLSLNTNISGTRNVYLFGFQSCSHGPFPVWEGGSCWQWANVSTSFLHPPGTTLQLSQTPSAGLAMWRWARTSPSLPNKHFIAAASTNNSLGAGKHLAARPKCASLMCGLMGGSLPFMFRNGFEPLN